MQISKKFVSSLKFQWREKKTEKVKNVKAGMQGIENVFEQLFNEIKEKNCCSTHDDIE